MSEARLEALNVKQAALEKEIARLNSRKKALQNAQRAKEREAKKKREDRIKFILGSFLLEMWEKKLGRPLMCLADYPQEFQDWLKPKDRALFDRQPASKKEAE